MGRTIGPDDVPSHSKKGERGRGPRSTQSRTVLISKALSRLLRHQAVNEGVPITNDGWVRLDHLLAWKGLSSRNGVNPPPTIEEIWKVVEENEKKRFAVRWVGKGSAVKDGGNVQATKKHLTQSTSEARAVAEKAKAMGFRQTTSPAAGAGAVERDVEMQDQPATTNEELTETNKQQRDSSPAADYIPLSDPQVPAPTPTPSEIQAETETARAIAHYRNTQPPLPPTDFQIRATQGHSIQTVASDTSLFTPITLDDPASIPDVCVHGTFYSAWPLILRGGGLNRMGRNHVHFAAGPSLAEVGVTDSGHEDGAGVLSTSDRVISGKRHDAELLVYVDLKRCLEDVRDQGVEMLWWRSENGVILTEGVGAAAVAGGEDAEGTPNAVDKFTDIVMQEPQVDQQEPTTSSVGETANRVAEKVKGHGGRHKAFKSKFAQAQAQSDKLVPMKYWIVVIDIKGGHGVIWRQGEGTVKELPEALMSRGTPKFRGRGRGRGRSR